nr:TetR/AcrR family transcriptional regulator [Propionicimonas sp.]
MTSPSPRLGRKTGPKPTFNSQDVINAAVSLGLDRFTMADVAGKIGVTQSALYRLFDSREALLQACLGQAAAAIMWPHEDWPWSDQLRSWAFTVWNVCEQYTGLDQTLLTTPGVHAHIQAGLSGLLEGLQRAGLPRERAKFAISLMGDVVLTAHVRVAATRGVTEAGESRVDAANRWLAEASANLGVGVDFPLDGRWMGDLMDERIDFVIRGLE